MHCLFTQAATKDEYEFLVGKPPSNDQKIKDEKKAEESYLGPMCTFLNDLGNKVTTDAFRKAINWLTNGRAVQMYIADKDIDAEELTAKEFFRNVVKVYIPELLLSFETYKFQVQRMVCTVSSFDALGNDALLLFYLGLPDK